MNSIRWLRGLGMGLALSLAAALHAAPANDNFANRITISGAIATVTGTNVAATQESGEPNNFSVSGGHSVWWTWTAPFSGLVEVDTVGSTYDTTLGIYTGTTFPLTEIIDNDDKVVGVTSSYVAFNATANTNYRILVDGYGSNTGAITLRLNPNATAPAITTQPDSTAVLTGSTAGFSVVATGGPSPTYQWRRNGVNLVNGGRISGATSANLAVATVVSGDAGDYTVVVTTAAGTVTSSAAALTVFAVPVVTSQPVSLTKNAGASASFSVVASGVPSPSYQWRKGGVDLDDGGNISGANTSTLTLANVGAGDVGSYTVYIFNSQGNTTSNAATLAVNLPPTITVQPVSLTRSAGASASFSVTATGTPTLTYLWRKNGVALANDGKISGATTATLTITNVQASEAASYTVAVTNAVSTAISNPGTLSLNANDLFAGAIVLTGGTANGTGSNTTAAAEIGEPNHAGNTAARSVWWRWTAPATGLTVISTTGSSFDTVLGVYTGLAVGALTPVATNDDGGAGAGTSSVTFTATAGTVYQIAVDGYQGATGTVALAISQSAAPVITAISSPRQVVTLGQNLTLSATATGTPTLTYQWKRNGRAITGATSASYTITGASPARDNGWYQVAVTNAGGTTSSAVVFVNVAVSPGELIFKGDSSYGTSTPPSGLTNIVSVAAGGFHAVALKGDGTVVAWGYPDANVTTVPSAVTSPATANVVAIAVGNMHSLALKADGTVVAWGFNGSGQSTVPSELASAATANVVSVAAGTSHSLALKANGTVVAWGSNSNGQSTVPSSLANPATANVVAVAAGGSHSLALKSDGTVVAWGNNASGQAPASVGLTAVANIAAGSDHSVALKTDGTVAAWGSNNAGQATVPGGLTGVAGIAAKGNHTVAYKTTAGTVVAWGSNSYGESTLYTGLDKVVGMTAGFQFTIALRNASAGNFATMPVISQQPVNQTVFVGEYANFQVTATAYPSLTYQWRKGGVNISGATGSSYYFAPISANAGSYDVVVTSPAGSVTSTAATLTVNAAVAPVITAQSAARQVVTGGGALTLSVTATGGPTPSYVWKRNGRPIAGATGATYAISDASPVRDNGWYQVEVSNGAGTVTSSVVFVNVAVAAPQILDGGDNVYGQLTEPANLGLAMAVDGGGYHTLALRTDGTVAAWGAGLTNSGSFPNYGQSIVPAALASAATAQVVALAGGGYHSVALKSDGTVVAWGAGQTNTGAWPQYGQALIPADLASAATAKVVAISAGDGHTIALRADGTVRAWGSNSDGQIAVPSDLTNAATAHVVAISAGRYHNLALQADGTVRAWGYNYYGQSTVPANTFTDTIVGVSAGSLYSTVLQANGVVIAWGYNYYGQNTVPNDVGVAALVAAGGYHMVALRTDGTVRAWGDDTYGQATMPEEVTGVFAISAGEIHTVMLRDGAVPWLNLTIDVVGGNIGDSATFDPTITGLEPFGVTYQWYRNGDPIAGATNKKYVRPVITASDRYAEYTLVASSFSTGSQTFGPWTITVNGAVELFLYSDTSANAGENVSLQVEFVGFPNPFPSLQWQKDGNNIAGATGEILTLTNVQASAAGRYTIVATTPYQTESAETLLSINKTDATVTVSSRAVTYDGTAKSVTASTIPGGLAVTLTYGGSSTPPTDVGVYNVHAAINNAGYTGEADGTLTITPASATVTIPAQVVGYNGSPRSATVTTTPNGIPVSVTYNGSLTAPTSQGHYDVVAMVTSPNYTGSGSGSLDIVRATPVITWATPAAITYGTPLGATQLNATPNVPGTFTYTPAVTTVLSVGSHNLSVTFKPSDIGNYTNATAQTTLSVTKIPATFALSATSFTYTGAAQGPTVVPNPTAATFTSGGTSSATNAGNYAATATATGNYSGSNTALNWTIAKANQVAPVVTSAASAEVGGGYTATANTGFGAISWALGTGSTAAGAAVDAATGVVSFTGTGVVKIKARFAGDANHNTSSYCADFTITVSPAVAPSVTGHPLSLTVTEGRPASFSVTASGTAPFTYQWRKNGNNIGGATGSTYTIASTVTGDTGAYSVVVSNSVGSGVSNAATLAVRKGVVTDFNGDGKTDLLWQNMATGERAIWYMDGTAVAGGESLGVVPVAWQVAACADFNGDNYTDFVWQNNVSGERVIWLMNGAGVLSSTSLGVMTVDWQIATAGDFSGDGKPDLVWQHAVTGDRVIWTLSGTSVTGGGFIGNLSVDWSMVASGDFNEDGKSDLVMQNIATGERAIWLMNGMTFLSSVSLGVTSLDWSLAGVADINRDGMSDILVQHALTGERKVWLMNGTTKSSEQTITTLGTDWALFIPPLIRRASADFDSNGKTDLVWQRSSSREIRLWLMNGTVHSSTVSLGDPGAGWKLAGSGDFDGDSQTDLVLQNTSTGERRLWLMDEGSVLGTPTVGTRPVAWTIACTGDFNRDGRSDLVWQNTSTGEREIWLMSGATTASVVSLGTVALGWQIAAAGDFDADGRSDLVWQNTTSGERLIWFMSGTVVRASVSLATVPLDWKIVGTGDFNGDTKTDIIWQNTNSGDRLVWIMVGTLVGGGISLGNEPLDWSIRN